MKRNIKNLFLILLLPAFIFYYGCEKKPDNAIPGLNESNLFSPKDIDRYPTDSIYITELESDDSLVESFMASDFYDDMVTTLSDSGMIDDSYLLSFEHYDAYFLIIPVVDNDSIYRYYQGCYYIDTLLFIDATIIDSRDYGDSTKIRYRYPNGQTALVATIEDSSGEVTRVFSNGSASYEPLNPFWDCWISCMQIAWTSCESDPSCSFLCNLVLPECLAAMGLACTYVCWNSNATSGNNN